MNLLGWVNSIRANRKYSKRIPHCTVHLALDICGDVLTTRRSNTSGLAVCWFWRAKSTLNPITSLKSWQRFEKFVVSFRCIKSTVIEEDELTTIPEVPAGAHLNAISNLKTTIYNLKLQNTIQTQDLKLSLQVASPYGDSFLSLDQPGTKSPNEIYQFKLRKKAVSEAEYQKERDKSASEKIWNCR